MATTLQPRPAPAAPAAATPPPPPPTGPRAVSTAVGAGAELSVILLTVAAVVSLGRLFTDGSFLPPVLLAVFVAHGLAWGTRRLGLGMAAAVIISALGLLVVVAYVVEPQTLSGGLPLGRTWHAVSTDLRAAVDRFNSAVPPAPVTRGFVLACVLAAWVSAFLTDVAAFRVAATFEAVIPSFTMFMFGSVLAFNRNRLAYSAFYLGAILLFVLLIGAARREETANWLAGRRGPGSRALVGRGVAVGAAAVLAATLIGPDLPGAGSAPVFNWRNRDNGPSSRTTISPLVDIRARLIDQSDNELFTVQASAPDYWRITALDRFDGKIWSSVGTYKPAGGPLPTGVRSRAPSNVITQRFAISGLSSIWLPAAFRPARLDGIKHVRYDAESASLLTDADTSNGLVYKVESAHPEPTAGDLERATNVIPQSVRDRYLDLPNGFPTSVTRLAAQVTAAASTPYAKAKALQDYLHDNFTYDLRVPAGHDDRALERFLFTVKRGYCEQFAGAYAAMARAIGLPSRVAVGFTPGQQAADGTYRVVNRDAHAWPEVYLSGFGWVAFEPTPGRGAPGDQGHTGVAPMQIPRAPAAPSPTATPTTVPGAQTAAPTTIPKDQNPTNQPAAHHGRSGWVKAALALAVLLALAAAAAAAAVIRRTRFVNRRRASATTPEARVLVAWDEAEEALALAGHRRRRAETQREYATRVPGPAGVSPGPLQQLAGDTAEAAYSEEGVATHVVGTAQAAARQVRSQLAARATRGERLRWLVGLPSKRRGSQPRLRVLETLVPRS
jgi:transglutaminase-like putative cysteine protease